MTPNMIIALSLVGIIFAIFLGWKLNINIGLIAMVFAYIINCWLMKGKVMGVINYWPVPIMFFMLAVSLFYGFAVINGTMKVASDRLLRLIKGKAALFPAAIFVISLILSFLGAGGTTAAIIGPVAFALALEMGTNPGLIGMSIALGGAIGMDNPFSGESGIIVQGLLSGMGYEAEAFHLGMNIWTYSIFLQILTFVILYIVWKGYRGKNVALNETQELKFNPVQKKTFTLIVIVMVVLILPKVLNFLVKSDFTKYLSNCCEPQGIMVLAALISALMKLADSREVIKRLPMNTILILGGVTMLMTTAKNAGLTDVISAWVSTAVPAFLIPMILVFIAGFLSFFSGGVSVVCPLLFPMIPAIVSATGLPLGLVLGFTYVGATCTGTSPFSTGGAFTVSTAVNDEQRGNLFYGMIKSTLLRWVVVMLAALIFGIIF